MKIFMIILTSFMMVGCSNKIDSRLQYDSKVFKQGKKGVVIVNFSQQRNYTLGNTPASLSLILNHLETNEIYRNISFDHDIFSASIQHQYQNCVLMLDPGVYVIKRLFLAPEQRGNFVVTKWISDNSRQISKDKHLIGIGAFEVKSGEVLYLGKLELDDSGQLPFKLVNEIDLAKNQLKEAGRVDLTSKMQMGTFYQIGTILEKQNNSYVFKNISDIIKIK